MLKWIFVWGIVFFLSGSIITSVCLFLSTAALWSGRLALLPNGGQAGVDISGLSLTPLLLRLADPLHRGTQGKTHHHREGGRWPPQAHTDHVVCLLWGWTMWCSQCKNWLPTHGIWESYTSVHTVNKDNPLHVRVHSVRELYQRAYLLILRWEWDKKFMLSLLRVLHSHPSLEQIRGIISGLMMFTEEYKKMWWSTMAPLPQSNNKYVIEQQLFWATELKCTQSWSSWVTLPWDIYIKVPRKFNLISRVIPNRKIVIPELDWDVLAYQLNIVYDESVLSEEFSWSAVLSQRKQRSDLNRETLQGTLFSLTS